MSEYVPNLQTTAAGGVRARWHDLQTAERTRIAAFGVFLVAGTVLFIQPLLRLAGLAQENELHSHIVLVPWISLYLLAIMRQPTPGFRTSVAGAAVAALITAGALAMWHALRANLSQSDELAILAFAYLMLLAAGGLLLFGARWMAAAAFPLGFLIFMVPMPEAMMHWLEQASVQASADAAAFMFRLSGTPLLREGTVLALPGITLEVARECSGIRSSWVLFITSVLASHMFLRSPWRRFVLVAFVIPLAIVRNAFRILVIGLLCVQIGPHMIDSFIHRRGGPLFFVASLLPLLLLLWWLRRGEQRRTG